MTLHTSEENEQNARDSLLRYYSSSNNVHGTYILAVAIGVFTFVQSIDVVEKHLTGLSLNLYLSFMISVFFTVGLYLFLRTLYWGVLAGTPIWTHPASIKDMREAHQRAVPGIPFPESISVIYRLHHQCYVDFRNKHPLLAFFNSGKRLFFLIFVPGFVLLLFHFSWISI